MFFFRGNYRYAIDRFDYEALSSFPQYTMLRLREINSVGSRPSIEHISEQDENDLGQSTGLMRGPAQAVYDAIISNWKIRFPGRARTSELISGEETFNGRTIVLHRPDNISFSVNPTADAESNIQRVLEERYGRIVTSTMEIGEDTWAVVRLADRSR